MSAFENYATGATYLFDYSLYPILPGSTFTPPVSPGTAIDFQGLTDNNVAWPPDTHGAVGTNHVVTMLNTEVRILTRDGTTITNMSLANFWSSTNISNYAKIYSPRILYDPFNHRWIASAAVEPYSTEAGILIGVSRTSSPTNTGDSGWILGRVKADTNNVWWPASPMLGFNKDWIVVSANMWRVYGSAFDRQNFYVFFKTNLYAGVFTNRPTLLYDNNKLIAGNEFPAVTYDNSLSTLYILKIVNGNYAGYGWMRLLSITGAVESPVLNNIGTNPIFIQINSTWDDIQPNNGADFAPQLGITNKVQNNDSAIGNVVFRNGHLWFAHTAFLPAGGNPTRSTIQWGQLHPTLGMVQFGRLTIPYPYSTNFYYAFPSIAVNRFNDALIGFSCFSSNQYVSANYAFRDFTYPQNMLMCAREFKSGEDSYWKYDNTNRNRWGDYSATCIDPANDKDFWTVQEYSDPHVGSLTNGSGRWAVWWGNLRVTVPTNDDFSSPITISSSQGFTNGTNIRGTKESGEPNHAGNSGGASVWYQWTAPANGSVTIDTIGSALDTLLAVYTGSSVGSLMTVANDHGSAGGGASRVTLTATSNITYRIAVDGYNGAMGNLVLNWLQPTGPVFVKQPQSKTNYPGYSVTFSSYAIGAPDPSYQWQFNSANISGATSSNYTIAAIQTNDAGNYTVIASNDSCSVTSAVAVLTVLTTQATLSSCAVSNNAFQFSIAQVSNLDYIVQVNTNLGSTNWVAIATNTAPFTFTDTAFTNDPYRFYRALYKP